VPTIRADRPAPPAHRPTGPYAVAGRPAATCLSFSVLGPVEVDDGRYGLTPTAHKPRTLLAALLVRPNTVVSVETLTFELWGPRPPPTALRALRVYVSQLRKMLSRGGAPEWLVTRPPGYRLDVAPAALDATLFEQLCRRGRDAAGAGDCEAAVRDYSRALGLWRGPALADVRGGPVVSGAALRLDEAYIVTAERLIDLELVLGRHRDLIGRLAGLTTDHPLHEGLHARMMIALHRSGRTSDALAVYLRMRRHLLDELGCEPGSDLRAAHRAILSSERAEDITSAWDAVARR
jgi:SARP family transcriptional regulator, regulator of embCAB operon